MKSSVVLTYITWIMKDRSDSLYKHGFFAGNTTLRDLSDAKVHVPCAARGAGVCDGCALVPRPFMSSYFSLPFSVVAECWSMDVLHPECTPNKLGRNWENWKHPEAIFMLSMAKNDEQV